jgi:hypothetical protein
VTRSRLALADLVAPTLFAAAASALFWEALTLGHTYFQDDTVTYYVPLARRIKEALAEGRLPLWTPWVFGGHPIFADSESAMLYPPNLLSWLLLDPFAAQTSTRMLRFFLASAFTWLFARAIGLSRPGAALAGIAFGFGSFMVGELHHKNLADCALWLPAVLWALERGMQSRDGARLRWWLAGGLALGIQLLTIHVNPALMTLMVVSAYALARAAWLGTTPVGGSRRAALRVGVAALATMVLVGFGVAAVQLLPLYELSTHSFRGRRVDPGFANAFNLPPANLLTLVFPYFFREPFGGAYWSPWFRWNTTLYVGVTPLLLAAAALAARRSRHVAFFALLALAGVILAMGANLPVNVYEMLRQLPVLSSTRVPSRYLLFAAFGLAVLAGFGLDAVTRREGRRAGLGASLIGTAAIGGVLLAWVLVPANRELVEAGFVRPYASQPGSGMTWAGTRLADHFGALLASLDPGNGWTQRGLVGLGVAVVLIVGCAAAPRLGPWGAWALVALAAVDLVLFARDFHPRLPMAAVTAQGPAFQFLAANNDRLRRVATQPDVWETVPNRLVPLRIPEANGYSSLLPDRPRAYMAAAMRLDNRLLELMGVRYVVARRDNVPAPMRPERPVFEDPEVAVFERPRTMPRAFVVGAARHVLDGRSALFTLQRPDFDLTGEAVVEDPTAAIGLSRVGSVGRAEIVAYEAEQVVVRASLAEPGLLVLTDTYYPGWRAYLNGREVPVHQTDYVFRGVRLPPGEHTVRFLFQPVSFRLGAAVTLATLLAVAAAVASTTGWRLLGWRPSSRTVQPAGT